MRKLAAYLVIGVTCGFVGCQVKVSTPGTSVQVGPSGVKVNAPGTKVNVSPAEGVQVDAPRGGSKS
jgi:hypothetical protein